VPCWKLIRRGALALTALVVGGLGCNKACCTPPDPPLCSGGVTVTVDPTPTPDFNWSPTCGLAQLVVQEVEAPAVRAVRWRILGDALMPPIHYGVVPSGGTAVDAAQPLIAGHTYRVTAHLDRSPSAPVAGSVTWIATIIGTP
jgi:hypothetical protein